MGIDVARVHRKAEFARFAEVDTILPGARVARAMLDDVGTTEVASTPSARLAGDGSIYRTTFVGLSYRRERGSFDTERSLHRIRQLCRPPRPRRWASKASAVDLPHVIEVRGTFEACLGDDEFRRILTRLVPPVRRITPVDRVSTDHFTRRDRRMPSPPRGSHQTLAGYLRPAILVGLTATPSDPDGRSLLPDFDGRTPRAQPSAAQATAHAIRSTTASLTIRT